MQENELPKDMGKKIVDALNQQDYNEEVQAAENTMAHDTASTSQATEDSAFDFGEDKDYKPVFDVNEADVDSEEGEMRISIENDEDVEEFEMPNNINVLRRLVAQLPTGVPRQTGALIIRQTIEALGIPMKTVLQDAQRVRDLLNSSIKDCNYTIQEYKNNIRTLERQANSYQKQLNKLNDIIGLFVYNEKK